MKSLEYTESDPDLERLRQRAISSAGTVTDSRTLEWMVEMSDLLFVDYNPIYCGIAENPHINLRTSLILASSRFSNVREALLRNPEITAGVLYGLTFDVEPRIRDAAVSHRNLSPALSDLSVRVKKRYRKIFEGGVPEERRTLSSYGVFMEGDDDVSYRDLINFLQIAYSEPEYWDLFAEDTGYVKWHLRYLVNEITSIPINIG